jgi:6-pyruvoyltetrahydropterin/6-carboxytetrahydropterin synthase
MYFITKKFKVPIGHRLSKHLGLCNNLHGHNLIICVELMGDKLNDNDMIIDFSDLKKIVNTFLDDFDHSCLLNSNDITELTHCVSNNRKYLSFDNVDPTAEILSKYLNLKIDNFLHREYGEDDFCCFSVTVWENEDSSAKYIDNDNVKVYLETIGL